MQRRCTQAPGSVIMVRPHHFVSNPETAADNAFQRTAGNLSPEAISEMAHREASDTAETLRGHGVRVHVFEDRSADTPDSVFPNNGFSTHPGGHVALYPMYAPNRRRERRIDVIEMLKHDYFCRVIEDCVAGSSEAAHEASLRAMEYLQKGARRSLDEALDAMRGYRERGTAAPTPG